MKIFKLIARTLARTLAIILNTVERLVIPTGTIEQIKEFEEKVDSMPFTSHQTYWFLVKAKRYAGQSISCQTRAVEVKVETGRYFAWEIEAMATSEFEHLYGWSISVQSLPTKEIYLHQKRKIELLLEAADGSVEAANEQRINN